MCSCTPCIGADQSQLPTNLVVCCPHILYLRTFQRNKHRSRTAAAIDSMRVAPQKKKKLATKDMYISRSVWLKKVFEYTHNFLGPSKRANKHWTNIHTQVHNTVPASVHEVNLLRLVPMNDLWTTVRLLFYVLHACTHVEVGKSSGFFGWSRGPQVQSADRTQVCKFQPLKRVPTPLFGRHVKCSTHGHALARLLHVLPSGIIYITIIPAAMLMYPTVLIKALIL